MTGDTDASTRARVFDGFNTPLPPEVLVCTSVGQEGIDLDRHCRHVIHYDLPWNPAVLEQRTGRTDRIGSKTFPERGHEVALSGSRSPVSGGTYDERMYEQLRLRARTFEVLTGGDMAAENPEGDDEVEDGRGGGGELNLVALPEQMVADLRVTVNVWERSERNEEPGTPARAA